MAASALKLGFLLSATDKMSAVVSDAINKSTDKLNDFERRTSKLAKGFVGFGAKMAGAGLALGGGMFALANSTANAGNEIFLASQRIGMSTDSYQKLGYAFRQAGVDASGFQYITTRLNRTMIEAAAGNQTQMALFKDLGIAIKDSSGQLRSQEAILKDLANVYASVEDGAGKTAHAVALLGRQGANAIPMLNAGADGLKELMEEAYKLGIMSNAQVIAANEFSNAMTRMNTSLAGVRNELGSALIPIFTDLIDRVKEIATRVRGWIEENRELAERIGKIALAVSGFLIVGGALSMLIGSIIFIVGKFAAAIKGIVFVFGLAQKATILFSAALWANPITWVVAGIVALIAAVVLLVRHWDTVAKFFTNLWERIKGIFSSAWEWIKNLFLRFHPVGLVITHWDTISAWFRGLWDRVKGIFSSAWEWIKGLFLRFHPIGLVIQHWETIVGWFRGLWDRVKSVFVSAWDGIGEFFSDLKARFTEWGRNIIQGLVDGIRSMISAPVDAIRELGSNITGRFRNLLGISSPSKIFAEYGLNITQGLSGGIYKGTDEAVGSTQGLALQTVRAASAGNSYSTDYHSYGGASVNVSQTFNINGGGDMVNNAVTAIQQGKREIERMIEDYFADKSRLAFAD